MKKINLRFKDASWLGQDEDCIVGGAGGIGSWLTLFLARAGFFPTVYDFDTLEEHNLGGQLYPSSGIGKLKVEALFDMVKDFADKEIGIDNSPFTYQSMACHFMFSGFDNMQARKDMFLVWEKFVASLSPEERAKCIFIDGRLLAEQMQIFCIVGNRPNDMADYRQNHLFDDTAVEDGPCSMRQTSHAAAIIAGMMTGFFTNHVHNIRSGNTTRRVPFRHDYFIPLDLTTE